MSTAKLLCTNELLDRYFLSWQKLLGSRWHFPWQTPQWWSRTLEHFPQATLPYWAVVHGVDDQLLGMLPVKRERKSGHSNWQLNLSPLNTGGIIGSQATAILNCVIRHLLQGREPRLRIDYDPADLYLRNRFDLAMEFQQFESYSTTIASSPWVLEHRSPSCLPANSLKLEGDLVWLETCTDAVWNSMATDGDWLEEFAEHRDVAALEIAGVTVLLWKFWRAPTIGIERLQTVPPVYRRPFAIFQQLRHAGRRSLDSVLQEMLEQFPGNWLLPESLMEHCQTDLGESQKLTQWAITHGYQMKRWQIHQCDYRPVGVWSQFRELIMQSRKRLELQENESI